MKCTTNPLAPSRPDSQHAGHNRGSCAQFEALVAAVHAEHQPPHPTRKRSSPRSAWPSGVSAVLNHMGASFFTARRIETKDKLSAFPNLDCRDRLGIVVHDHANNGNRASLTSPATKPA